MGATQIQVEHLAVFHYPVPSPAKATARILLIHGMGEHHARLHNAITAFQKQAYEVVAFDLRGMGQSQGRRMWIETFQDYVDDVRLTHDWIQHNLPPLKTFVMGHSLGGTIAIHFAAQVQNKIDGLLLSAPGFIAGAGISAIKIQLAKLLARIAPGLRVKESLDATALSRDPQVIADYRSDRLCCRFNTIRQGNEILRVLPEIPALARQIRVPTLIVHGESDRIVNPEGSQQIIELINAKHKTLKLLLGTFHEPHNDINRADNLKIILDWLRRF